MNLQNTSFKRASFYEHVISSPEPYLYSGNIWSKLYVCLLQMRSPGGEEILTKLLIKVTWKK